MSPRPYVVESILTELGRASGPECDDCLEVRAQLKYRQQANQVGRRLFAEGRIRRANGRCTYCGESKDVSWIDGLVTPPQVEMSVPRVTVAASHLHSPIQETSPLTALRGLDEEELLPGLRHRWEAVVEADGTAYRFPELPSRVMRESYNCPAVYRWVPFRDNHGDLARLYVGEAQSLVDRINNYRTGNESQQTSFRLRKLFEGYVADGHSVCLERLRFDRISLGSVTFTEENLGDKLFRRFVEHMMASYYRKLGWELINA